MMCFMMSTLHDVPRRRKSKERRDTIVKKVLFPVILVSFLNTRVFDNDIRESNIFLERMRQRQGPCQSMLR
jgi:hypothetical protein